MFRYTRYMKPILIFRHWVTEGPGYLAEVLDRNGLPWRLVAIDEGEPVPATLEQASALVFMGGPMSVNDRLAWVEQELRLIRAAHESGMPVLGHCLGGQLIAKALGGGVTKNPVREIGWLPVSPVRNAVAAEWLRGLPPTFDVFHWHGETFSLPAQATLILKGETCAHQGFAIGNLLALQCHVEMTEDLVRTWTTGEPAELAQTTATVQSAATMTTALPERIEGLHAIADRLYGRWLQPLFFVKNG